jgi:hypothetical protein
MGRTGFRYRGCLGVCGNFRECANFWDCGNSVDGRDLRLWIHLNFSLLRGKTDQSYRL